MAGFNPFEKTLGSMEVDPFAQALKEEGLKRKLFVNTHTPTVPAFGPSIDTRKLVYSNPERQIIQQTGILNTQPNSTMDPGKEGIRVGLDLIQAPFQALENLGRKWPVMVVEVAKQRLTDMFDPNMSPEEWDKRSREVVKEVEAWAAQESIVPMMRQAINESLNLGEEPSKIMELIGAGFEAGSEGAGAVFGEPGRQAFNLAMDASMGVPLAKGLHAGAKGVAAFTRGLGEGGYTPIFTDMGRALMNDRRLKSTTEWNDTAPSQVLKDVDGKPMLDDQGQPFGITAESEGKNGVRIKGAYLPEDMRGQGIGQQMYKQFLNSSHKKGKIVYSDESLNDAGRAMWEKMKAEGLDIRYNAEKQQYYAPPSPKNLDILSNDPVDIYKKNKINPVYKFENGVAAIEFTDANGQPIKRDIMKQNVKTGKAEVVVPRGSKENAGIQAHFDDGRFIINLSSLPADLKGKKLGISMYADLIDRIHEAGFNVSSDVFHTSSEAVQVYKALEKRGYKVNEHGNIIKDEAGYGVDAEKGGWGSSALTIPKDPRSMKTYQALVAAGMGELAYQYITGDEDTRKKIAMMPMVAGATFFSKAREVAGKEGIPKKPQSIIPFLEKHGVTKAEIKELGLWDWMKGKDRVEPAELQKFIDERGVKLGEDVYGRKPKQIDEATYFDLKRQRNDLTEKLIDWREAKNISDTEAKKFPEYNDMIAKRQELRDKIAEYENEDFKQPQFSSYQAIKSQEGVVPGSYTEEFVTADNIGHKYSDDIINDLNKQMWKAEEHGNQKLYDQLMKQKTDYLLGLEKPWKDEHTSQYGDTKNPLVRIRYDVKEYPDGRKVMRLQEIQDPKEVQKGRSGEGVVPQELATRAMDLGVKKAIARAKEMGLDGIEWSTGEQQRDLYNTALRGVADEARWNPETKELSVYKNGSKVQSFPNIEKDALADYIGKSGAERLLADNPANRTEKISKFKTAEEADNVYENIPTPERYYYSVMQNEDFSAWGIYDRRNGQLYTVERPKDGKRWYTFAKDNPRKGQTAGIAYFDEYLSKSAKEQAEEQIRHMTENEKMKGKKFILYETPTSYDVYEVPESSSQHIATDLSIDAKWPGKLYGDFSESSAKPVKWEKATTDMGFEPYEVEAGSEYFTVGDRSVNIIPFDRGWAIMDQDSYLDQKFDTKEQAKKFAEENMSEKTTSGDFNYKAQVPSLLKKYGKGEFGSSESKVGFNLETIPLDELGEIYKQYDPGFYKDSLEWNDGIEPTMREYGDIIRDMLRDSPDPNFVRYFEETTGKPQEISQQPVMWFTKDTPSTFPVYSGLAGLYEGLQGEIKTNGGGAKGVAKVAMKYGVPAALLAKFLRSDNEEKKKILKMPQMKSIAGRSE